MPSTTPDIALETKQEADTSETYDVVVVGAGPAGLEVALEAIKAGKKVLIIESRSEATFAARPQFVAAPNVVKSLIEHNLPEIHPNLEEEDLDFVEKSKAVYEHYTLKEIKAISEHYGIKDIQGFLKRRIDEYDDKAPTFWFESKVDNIDIEKGSLTIADSNKTVNFKHLYLADGAKHQTADKLSDFKFESSDVQRIHKKHALAYFTVSLKSGEPIMNMPMTLPLHTLFDGEYRGLIYNEAYSLEKSHRQKIKLCIVMSVDDDHYEIFKSNKELGIKYLKHCVASSGFDAKKYDISMTISKKDLKNQMKYTTFNVDFFEANQAAVERNGHVVALVGDTLYNPDFFLGHGVGFAYYSASAASNLCTGKWTVSDYNSYCKKELESRKERTVADLDREKAFIENNKNYFSNLLPLIPPFRDQQLEKAIENLHDKEPKKSPDVYPEEVKLSSSPHSILASPAHSPSTSPQQENKLASELPSENLSRAQILKMSNTLDEVTKDLSRTSPMRISIDNAKIKLRASKTEKDLDEGLKSLAEGMNRVSTGKFFNFNEAKTRAKVIEGIQQLRKELKEMTLALPQSLPLLKKGSSLN